MGACGSRLQEKQQRELTAGTTSKTRRSGGSCHSTTRSSTSTSTTTAPDVCRCTKADGDPTTATTSTSTSPKSFQQAPQAARPAPRSTNNNGLEFEVPIELVRQSVFPLLGAACLAQAGCVCRRWREASVDEQLWKGLCLKRWVGKHVGERVSSTVVFCCGRFYAYVVLSTLKGCVSVRRNFLRRVLVCARRGQVHGGCTAPTAND